MNALEKQLEQNNKALNYLIKLNESTSDQAFGIRNKKGKIILTGDKLAAARAKQQRETDKMLATWANYKGGNSYLEAVHGRDIGKISHGGGLGKVRALGLGNIKDWTFGQQNFNLTKDGSRYQTGHVAGLMSPRSAIDQLKKEQKVILNLLSKPRLTKADFKDLPWALIHSGDPELEKLFGRWDLGGEKTGGFGGGRFPNPLQIGGRSKMLSDAGISNPFSSDRFIDEYYAAKGSTKTVKRRRLLGILPVGGSKTITTEPEYNWPGYKVKTDHFSKAKNVNANSNQGSTVSNGSTYVNSSSLFNSGSSGVYQGSSQNVEFGSQPFFGRGHNVLKDGNITSLSINELNRDWNGVAPGDNLGVMTKGQRNRYRKALTIAGGPSYAEE